MLDIRKRNIRYILLVILPALCLWSCAKQGTLSGGPKDLDAPRIDAILSDQNFQTKFNPAGISLYFDEWVQLKNPSQILISPPLLYNPKISYKGKHVDVEFDEREVLRDSTTYAINFGNAITDFNESNPVQNYRFVFSTGDKIDSLILKGQVIDAFTRKAVNNVTVMLYDEYRDSVVYEEKPYYFAKTDKTGLFKILNLKGGKFKCFALLDSDYNFLYNQESEQIGFPDSLIEIKADSLVNNLQIELFLPTPQLQVLEAAVPKRGKVKIKFTKIIDRLEVIESNMPFIEKEIMEDSLLLWYLPDTIGQDSLFFTLSLEGSLDTLELKSKNNLQSMGQINFSTFKYRKKLLNPGDKIDLVFNQIFDKLDTTKIQLIKKKVKNSADTAELVAQDSILETIAFYLNKDSADQRKLLISALLEEKQQYELTFFPGAIQGYFSNTNDTLVSLIGVESADNLGNIYCTFDSLHATDNYLVFLKQKDKILDERVISNTVSETIEFLKVRAGKYSLEIIVDENGNKRWDPGNYRLKKQSERKLEVNLEELRKNWDIETTIKWDSQ